jgi:hypothetical protein
MKRIAGIWDLARSGGSVGTLLILLEELTIQRSIHGAEEIHVVIVGDAAHLVNGIIAERIAPSAGLIIASEKLASPKAVLRAISGVVDIHVCADDKAIRDVMTLMRTDCVLWPDLVTLVQGRHSYDNTRAIQDYYARAGNIPRLSVGVALLEWAKGYLRGKSRGRVPVAVHLKNSPGILGQSSANIEAWLAFMACCEREHPVQFVLVGDDPTDARFLSLPNVTIARNDGATLDRYLAIIQAAPLFMGMMSGPANMALFGTNPYVIFKNPDHHAREMAMELGESDHYPFALAHQRVLRIWDTPQSLASAFEREFGQMVAQSCPRIGRQNPS